MAAAGALLLSLWRVRRLTRSATPLSDAGWRDAVETMRARLALRRPARVLVSDAVRTPMAAGVWRPIVFLPSEAASWTAERRDVVLAHELSHLVRRDPIRHVAARLAVACYWFHPLAWIAARQSTLAREQACDEAVLALGVRPSEYARVLLELADGCAASRATAAALPMIERSLLEARLMAVLDDTVRPGGRRPALVAGAALLAAVTLGAAQPTTNATTALAAAPVAAQPSPVSPQAPERHVTRFTGDVVLDSAQPPAQASSGGCWTDNFSGSFRGSSVTVTNAEPFAFAAGVYVRLPLASTAGPAENRPSLLVDTWKVSC